MASRHDYPPSRANDAYTAPPRGGYGNQGFDLRGYRAGPNQGSSDAYRPPAQAGRLRRRRLRPPAAAATIGSDVYQPPARQGRYGEPYPPGPREPYDREYGDNGPRRSNATRSMARRTTSARSAATTPRTRSTRPGTASSAPSAAASPASIEYTFQKAGRPNGYILGEDAGGAFVAGLRYGEGRLSTPRTPAPTRSLAGTDARL